MRRAVALAHGGAESDPSYVDGPRRAADAALRAMRAGGDALDAAVEAVRLLEDDERFNAGYGSNLRLDGETVHMDAAVVDSRGRFGSVIGLRDVRNPILVARDLLATPNHVLMGDGAMRFARRMGHASFDPRTPAARERALDVAARVAQADPTLPLSPAHVDSFWNFERPPLVTTGARRGERARASDTVGALAFDGETFAAAGSTGGLMAVLDGRVSDIALPGCGIEASSDGAVCCTGAGDAIIAARVASRALRLLEEGRSAEETAVTALQWVPPVVPFAILVLGREGQGAARGRGPFPWARAD